MRIGVKYLKNGNFMRDSLFAIPTFDFYFEFPIPKPNKERMILERDRLGRLVKSSIHNGSDCMEYS